MRAVIVGAVTASLLAVGAGPAEAARTCTPIRPQDHSVIGGQTVDTYLTGERCGDVVWVYDVRSVSWDGPAYQVTGMEVWRYAGALPSQGGVRSANIRVDKRATVTHSTVVFRSIPHRSSGWDGFVRVTYTTGGEVRTIALMI